MPTLPLTDLTIQRLKSEGQTRFMDTTLRGFGILVSQTTKTFIVVKGKDRKLKTLGRYPAVTLKNARRDAQRILADETPTPASTTYPRAVQRFLEWKKGHTKPATQAKYKYNLEKLDFTGKVSDLTKQKIVEGAKVFDGKPRAQNAYYVVMKTFLNWCYTEELIYRHPLYRARKPNIERSRDRVLSDQELGKIWHATDFKPYGYLVRLLMLTGARKMEVRHLHADKDHLTFKDTKNGTDHTLPITPLIREHLMDSYTWNNWQREKERLDERSGVSGWRIHDLRRTWATNAIRLGVRSEVVEAVLNHKPQGVKAVYQRWGYLPEMKQALLTVEAHLTKIITAQGTTLSRARLPSGVEHEDFEQTRATSKDNDLNSAHHPTGKGESTSVPEKDSTDTEQGRVAGVRG